MFGFGALEKLPWERISDKIERRVLAGKHGMIVWWKIKAGAHAGAHQHPHEQIVWMLKGKMVCVAASGVRSGRCAVIPGDTPSTKVFPEDTEDVDVFAPRKIFSPGTHLARAVISFAQSKRHVIGSGRRANVPAVHACRLAAQRSISVKISSCMSCIVQDRRSISTF
jgi:hypothetical protein